MFDPYIIIISISVLMGLSYLFNIVSKYSRVPSVLFLIGTGIAMRVFGEYYHVLDFGEQFNAIVQFLGIVGLIMIVLEAALELKLKRDKKAIITKSIILALVVLVVSALSIAFIIMYARQEAFLNSLVYAIPLSVVSSAVLIPSVHHLTERKREFLIYESTFSDILGIMFFNYIIIQDGQIFSLSGLWMVLLTIIVSIVLSYVLVFWFNKFESHIKLVLMLAILAGLYSLGKQLHLSALLIIFIFGLVLNNCRVFFRGRLKDALNYERVAEIRKELQLITGETAFFLRTLFFVAFGMSIDLHELLDIRVLITGSLVVIMLYAIRYVNFRIFLKTNVFPEIFLAPRGLITILLFYSIPAQYLIKDFSVGILFFVILATSIIMMIALMKTPITKEEIRKISYDINSENNLFDVTTNGPHCEISDNEKD